MSRLSRRLLTIAVVLLCGATAFGRTPPSSSAEVIHDVTAGQTLGMIAKRYAVSIDAICRANGISRKRPIVKGQRLVIPSSPSKAAETNARAVPVTPHGTRNSQPTGSTAAKEIAHKDSASTATPPQRQTPGNRWQDYKRSAVRSGYVTLEGTAGSFSGYAIMKSGRLAPAARLGFRRALASWRTGKQIETPERLIRLLARVSNTFGGRPLRIVGGLREHSFARDSKHLTGQAVDFSIPGVPNFVLADYLKTLPEVGVGYYPNSSFVHLDIRDRTTYWVDYSAPGEPPRYAVITTQGVLSD